MDQNDFYAFMESMHSGFDEELDKYSDEELNKMGSEMGLGELMAHFMGEAVNTKAVNQIKSQLKKNVRRILSKEVEDSLIDKRARIILNNNGVTLQIEEDDRLGENMENAMANFVFDETIKLPFSKHEKLDRFINEVKKDENKMVGDFFMRTPPEYLKLLIYYVKVKSFEDMKKLVGCYEDKCGTISEYHPASYDSFERSLFDECMKGFTEFMCGMTGKRFEYLLKRFKISSPDEFIGLFLNEPYSYPFLLRVNPDILDYFLDNGKIEDVDSFLNMIKSEDDRKISELDLNKKSGENLIILLKTFNIKKIEDAVFLTKSENIINILKKSSKYNFEILLENSQVKNIEEFDKVCSLDFIKLNIENTEYESMVYLLEHLGLEGTQIKPIIFHALSNYFDRDFGDSCKKLGKVIAKGDYINTKDFILSILMDPKNANELFDVLGNLLIEHGKDIKNCNFGRLIELKKFMGGYITKYLAKEILTTSDINLLTVEWRNTIKTFKDGKFDPKNELHQNLEYKGFRKIVTHENIQKYMKSHFSIYDYFKIFTLKQESKTRMYRNDEPEIECVAYEAGLLNDYILQIKEMADKIGKKVLVVPNLSYGYLPIAPIYDALSKQGIEFLIGAKVGSTECHNNSRVINSQLLKNCRSKIVNEQPIILIIDGTQHLLDRDGGEGKSARYPDAYQGYLNQIIAINDSFEKDKNEEDKREISYIGKNENQIRVLRESQEFERTVNIYHELSDKRTKRPYDFAFWNTSGMKLIIRSNREKADKIEPFNPKNLRGPTMIFCNIGVLHDQLPHEIKKKFDRGEHVPAYFDDSGRIVNFEFSFNEYGVSYINNLEDELKKVYGRQTKSEQDIEKIAALLKHASKNILGAIDEGYEGHEGLAFN